MRRWAPVILVVAALAAYANSFHGAFIFDDIDSIKRNPTIRHLWPPWEALSPPHRGGITVEGRPLVNFSLAINYALGGDQVWGYHALNLTIHVLAGLVLLGIMRRTLSQPILRDRFGSAANGLALAIAVLWTIHPVQTESVTYIVQRAESFMGLLYLLTLYCFIRGAESPEPRQWYGLSLVACAFGMASKEVMVSAPVMVMLYDRTFLSGSFREAWQRRWRLYLALASTWVVLGYLVVFTGSLDNHLAEANPASTPWWKYFLTEPGVVLHYLRLSVWPYPLCFDYSDLPIASTATSFLLPALAVAVLLGASAWACRKNSAWGFLGAWFVLILAPTSSFIALDSPAYEHRMYLPLAVAIVTVVLAAAELTQRWVVWARGGLAGAVVIVCGSLTVARNADYRSEETIWRDTIAKRPRNVRALVNLGTVLAHAGQTDEALVLYRRALEINPSSGEAHFNLGVTLAGQGNVADALPHLREAVALVPNSAVVHYNLGIVLVAGGRLDEAIANLGEAVRLNPRVPGSRDGLGAALASQGRVEEALPHFREALRLDPNNVTARRHLATALIHLGRTNETTRGLAQPPTP